MTSSKSVDLSIGAAHIDEPTDDVLVSVVLKEQAPAAYARLRPHVRSLPMNTLFADAVLALDAAGRVAASSGAEPAVGYVCHAYGMSLLFGEVCDPSDRMRVLRQVVERPRTRDEWLQVSSASWAQALDDWAASGTSGAAWTRHTRVNFQFSPARFRSRPGREPAALARPTYRVERVGAAAFAMPGSVVPRAFFRDAEHFQSTGTGFAVIEGDRLAALAFSAFVTPTQLEIGIETLPTHRGQGLAAHACAALIHDCLAQGLEPVWACRLENTASVRLAQSLGFEPVQYLPYFCLHANTADGLHTK